jgi:two-component system sensor histidine kinase CiaH
VNVRSARLQLTAWYAAVFGCVLLILGLAVFLALTWALDKQVDAGIDATVQQWRASTPDIATLPALPSPREHDGEHETRDNFVLAFRADGTLIGNPAGVSVRELLEHVSIDAGATQRSVRTTQLEDERVRLHVIPISGSAGARGVVVGARSLHDRDEQVQTTVVVLGAVAGAGLAMAVGVGYVLAGRALRPLAEAYRRQQQFVADASHELRAPLTVIRTSADLLLRGGVLAVDQREAVTQIQDVTSEAGRLVEQLLQLARMEQEPPHDDAAHVDLAEVARRECARFEPQLATHGSTVALHLDPAEAALSADEAGRVLRVLIENVIAHTPPGTPIEVTTGLVDGHARLMVADGGRGVPAEQRAAIFERFARVDAARTPGTGTGLGLAIVAAIARRRRGQVRATASAAGGLSVECTLPPWRGSRSAPPAS